jgi:hypothetical protein
MLYATTGKCWKKERKGKVLIGNHVFAGGAANAYIPSPEEEEREKKIQEQEAELIRVRTQSKDRVKEIEHERQDLRKESPSA